jgi:hypothetical protein
MVSLYGYSPAETAQQLREDLATVAVASLEQAFANPKGFYVYLLWGEDPEGAEVPEKVLYVGKSANVFNRLAAHATGRGTGNGYTAAYKAGGHRKTKVTRVSLLDCGTREVMDHVEVELIAHFQPPHNLAQSHVGPRHPTRASRPLAEPDPETGS